MSEQNNLNEEFVNIILQSKDDVKNETLNRNDTFMNQNNQSFIHEINNQYNYFQNQQQDPQQYVDQTQIIQIFSNEQINSNSFRNFQNSLKDEEDSKIIRSSQNSQDRKRINQEVKQEFKRENAEQKQFFHHGQNQKHGRKIRTQQTNMMNSSFDRRKAKAHVGTDPLQSEDTLSLEGANKEQHFIKIPTAPQKNQDDVPKRQISRISKKKTKQIESFNSSASHIHTRNKFQQDQQKTDYVNPLTTKQLLPPKRSSTNHSQNTHIVASPNIKSSSSEGKIDLKGVATQEQSQRVKTESEIYAEFNYLNNSQIQIDKYDQVQYQSLSNKNGQQQILHDDQNENQQVKQYLNQELVAYGKQLKNQQFRISEQNDLYKANGLQQQNKINLRKKLESQSHDFNKTQQSYYSNFKAKINLWALNNQQKVFQNQFNTPGLTSPNFEIKGKSALYQQKKQSNINSVIKTNSNDKLYTDRKDGNSTIENSHKVQSKVKNKKANSKSKNVLNVSGIGTNRIMNLTDSLSIENSKQIFDVQSDSNENRINLQNYSKQDNNFHSLKKQLKSIEFVPTSSRYEIQGGAKYRNNLKREIQISKDLQNIGTQRLPEQMVDNTQIIISPQVDKNILKMGIILKSMDSSSNYHSELQS